MDYLSKAKNMEERALATGFLRGEAAWLGSIRPLRAIVKFSKWLRGAKVINAIVTAASAALIYIQSYAVLLVFAGAAAMLSAAFLLLALPISAAAYIAAGKKCAKEASRLKALHRPVCFVFLSAKLSKRPFMQTSLRLLSEENELYVVTGSISVGGNGGKKRIGDGISYVHRAFYHRLKKELIRVGFGERVTVVI